MRIALLTNGFLPHSGGSRVYYYNLFKRIAAMGDEVTILTSKVKGWEDFDAKEQAPLFRIKRNFETLGDLSYPNLPKIAGPMLVAGSFSVARRPDALYCGDLYPQAVVGLVLKRLLGIPIVAFCHGEDITLTAERRFQWKLRNHIYRSADAIIANGEFSVQGLASIGIDPSKVYKITPGLDTSLFHPEDSQTELKSRYGIDGELVVMTVARLVSRKGHKRVLRALAEIAANVPSFKYVIVGRGPLEAELRALTAELNLEQRVVFAGFVPDDQLNHHYNLADIVVMPNTGDDGDVEGFGMVFLEANAAGKPVIGGRSGGTSEAILDRETGFLVDPSEDRELRDALQTLLNDDKLRQTMGAAGLHRARTDFSWDTRASAVHEITRVVANASKAST
jgi:phosphatidylinositol alpha-1,6-mannosyltransferase